MPLRSNMTVMAHGARFILPETLPDQARVVLFAGENIAHFAWHGGEFVGHVFDPAKKGQHLGAECEHEGHRDHHDDRGRHA
jgi:hypothetical protein